MGHWLDAFRFQPVMSGVIVLGAVIMVYSWLVAFGLCRRVKLSPRSIFWLTATICGGLLASWCFTLYTIARASACAQIGP